MVDNREILRLFSLKYIYTYLTEALHSSRNISGSWLMRKESADISRRTHQPKAVWAFYIHERSVKKQIFIEPDCAYIHEKLAKKGVNLTLLHREYKVKCASVWAYTLFVR